MPATVMPRTEDVVEGQPDVVERLREVWDAVDREHQGLDPDEMGSERQEPRSLGQRFANQPEAELLQVPQAAMDEPRRARRGAGSDVVLLDERGAHPAGDRIQQSPGPHDAATDDHDIPGVRRERRDIGPAAIEGTGYAL